MPGEPQLSSNTIFGVDASDVKVLDPQGIPSNLIIRRGDAFKLQTTLKFGGRLAPVLLCCSCWECCYCFDPCDYDPGGPEPKMKTFCSPKYCGVSNKFEYDGTANEVTIQSNDLDIAVYKLTAVFKFQWHCPCRYPPNITRPPITAYADGPVIEIYQG
jgi:hypothetical protein